MSEIPFDDVHLHVRNMSELKRSCLDINFKKQKFYDLIDFENINMNDKKDGVSIRQ